MEPFAYEKPKSRAPGRLFVAGLAAASLSIWYFDLIPQLDSVPTGTVDSGAETQSPDDFLALLDTKERLATPGPLPETGLPMDAIQNAGTTVRQPDSVYQNMLADGGSIEDSFPEFSDLSEPDLDPAGSPIIQASGLADSSVVQATYQSSLNSSSNTATLSSPFEPSLEDSSVVQLAATSRSHVTGTRLPDQKIAPSVLTAEVAQKLRDIDALIQQKSTLQAHAKLSELYWTQTEIRPLIQDRIDQTAAEIYINPNRHFAEPYVVDFGETLDQIAQKHHVPWSYLARLNSVTPKTLQAGQTLKVLKGPFGAVVDLKNFELTVHAHGWYVRRYRIGTGKNESTPVGTMTVRNKLENPQWYNPDGGIVDADDPSNPLGEYWLGLGDHIGIHGTIDPTSIGKAQSRGCIHLSDADIVEVFHLLSVGSPVKIRP